MRKPTPAFVLMPDGERIPAEIRPLDAESSSEGDRLVGVRLKTDAEFAMPAAVVFDLPDFSIDGETIRMRAADDLAGCGAILSALERLVTSGAEADLLCGVHAGGGGRTVRGAVDG